MGRTAALIALTAATSPAAEPAAGVFDGYDCAAPVSDQRVILLDGEIHYYETACRLEAPEPVAGMGDAFLYWADCAGEGQIWRERTLLMTRMGGDLIVVGDGWAERYARCPGLDAAQEARRQ
jgi:hypothetical protein